MMSKIAQEQKTNQKLESELPAWAIFVGLAFIGLILIVISITELTSKETTLLGTLLTLVSVGIGWAISHHYANQDKQKAVQEVRDYEQRNLRMYALKAAEKVTNLSVELNRLSVYLEEELQYTEYADAKEELFAKEERIESAIHILGSLRSINDTSLSDWQGVIGEELDEQRKHDSDKQEALLELDNRIRTIEQGISGSSELLDIGAELNSLRREVRAVSAGVDSGSFRSKNRSIRQIQIDCPQCLSTLKYKQKEKDGDVKAVQCKVCESNLISEFNEQSGVALRTRENLLESVTCPHCTTAQEILLDEWPTASTILQCPTCQELSRVSRAGLGKDLRIVAIGRQGGKLNPEVIRMVRAALPAQPWPKGIHALVAKEVGITPSAATKVIQHLIRTGVFMDQVDGVICTREEKIRLFQVQEENL